MNEIEMRSLVDRSIEAFNTSNWDLWRSIHTPNTVYDEVTSSRRLVGHDEILETFRVWKSGFPDLSGSITSFRTVGNESVAEVLWTGTHNGELQSSMGLVPPSGQSLNVRSVLLMKVENDLISESIHYLDTLAIFRQINALPASFTKSAGA